MHTTWDKQLLKSISNSATALVLRYCVPQLSFKLESKFMVQPEHIGFVCSWFQQMPLRFYLEPVAHALQRITAQRLLGCPPSRGILMYCQASQELETTARYHNRNMSTAVMTIMQAYCAAHASHIHIQSNMNWQIKGLLPRTYIRNMYSQLHAQHTTPAQQPTYFILFRPQIRSHDI